MTTVQGVDPRSGAPVGAAVPVTTADELESLLSAAEAAAPAFGSSTPDERIALLHGIADALDAARDELVPLAMAESGLPEARLSGEVARTSAQLRMFAEVVRDGGYLEVIIDSPDPAATPPRPQLHRWREPLGPVLVFGASNFPFAFSVLGGDTASALAAGCPVLVKAHSSHPGLSVAVGRLMSEVVAAQVLPPGVFGLLLGDELGVPALRDHRITAAGFTGSTSGGRFLFDVACGRPDPIPFYGELGSINPAVVTAAAAEARGEQIASGFVGSMTLGTGQFCTKPGLLFVPAGTALVDRIGALIAESAPGPLLNARIGDQLSSGRNTLEASGSVQAVSRGEDGPGEGSWATPVLYRTSAAALRAEPELIAAEYFGPNAIVVEYNDLTDLIESLDGIEGSLTATLHAEDGDPHAAEILATLRQRAGRVLFNGWPTGVAVSWAMQHGGPWPATTNSLVTSVGATAISRWLRPVCYQSVPEALLPEPLRSDNPWRLPRRLDGVLQL